jgi:hypothetical protein
MTQPRKHLVLHVEILGFYADDLDQCAGYLSEPDPPGPQDRLYIVTEEWMRAEVGIVLVSLPGEKCLSDDFEIHAYTGRIVGAEAREIAADRGAADGAAPSLADALKASLADAAARRGTADGDPT